MEREVIWVVVNTNSVREADKLGRACLKARLCACYGLIPRIKSVYYWPPKADKLEISKGPILTLETLESKYSEITRVIQKLHSDKVPLIGQWEIEQVTPQFYQWLKGELA
ncbi:MAG: divalent-cation tolerance protein CutA [Patescibacteria group bacterium]|nr:divalent-cation tolerance protein CutA [Patescibacteria group bacterium]